MKNFRKAGILIAILVLPVFIFVMMKVFFVNEFIHLEVFTPKVEGCELNLVNEEHRIPAFEGTNQLGELVTSEKFKGKVVVTNFFHTADEDQQLSFSMARALERFKNEDDVLLLSHTLAPAQDSAAVLAAFAKNYKAPANKWFFLQSNQEAINRLVECGYGVNVTQQVDTFTATQFVLVDKSGRIRGYYDGLDRKDINRLMDEIALLLLEYQKQGS